MKMNIKIKTICLGIAVAFLGLQACVNDLGNYDYIDEDIIMPVKINGLRDTVAKPNELLQITPDLQGLENEEDYEYYWYVRGTDVNDTLARTRNLSYEVQLAIGDYELYYEVKDPQLGIYVREMVNLEISSQLGTGWYVMKDIDGETDFDYIPDTESGERWNNVILSSGNERLNGKALKIYYAYDYTNEVALPDGTVELHNARAFLVGSTEDLKIFNANTMELFKDYNGMFYEAPANRRPQNFFASSDFYLINDGKLYTIAGVYVNSGKFGYAIPGLYDLHDDMSLSSYGSTVFDKNTSSFMHATVRANSLTNYPESETGLLSPTNMDLDLIRLLPFEQNTSNGAYALMKDDEEQEYYIIKVVVGRTIDYPFTFITTVPYSAGYEVFEADVMTASIAECVYFADGNLLKVYKNISSEDRENTLKEFPADETIANISSVRVFSLETMSNSYYVEVLTNSSNGWKLYRFANIGSTPEINPEPVIVHEGEGVARYVMYRQ